MRHPSHIDATNANKLPTQKLLEALVALDTDTPWASWSERDLTDDNTRGPAQKLAWLFKRYGIESRTIRLGHSSTPRGYRAEDLSEAWKRYLPAIALNNATFG